MKKTTIYIKKILLVITVLLSITAFTACSNNGGSDEVTDFTWWITDTDAKGTFYTKYEENPVIQWLNNQYWNQETGTYSGDQTGTKLNLSFLTALKGSESDNFNTMIATGSYPDIIDLAFSNDSPKRLFEEGITIEITEYVNKYMPNYVAYVNEHPELKPFLVETDENGVDHYYYLRSVSDSPIDQFQGYMYRRDWLIKYAEPTDYVWDWDSDFVNTNGHPKYTPLSKAVAENDYTGWKTNPVSSFTSNYGDENTWEDNIIFPSGKSYPLYISDWEWMLAAFKTAIQTEGFASDSNAYPISLFYPGYMETGDLVSSFGGGGPMWYIDQNGDAQFGGTGNTFKTYVEAMNTWYNNGWLDTRFETRSADMFFKINLTGVSQGKVGIWQGSKAFLGDTIRATAADDNAKTEAMVFGASLPINDVYGDESNKFVEPDTYYGAGYLDAASIAITEKASEKDLATLFTMLNYLYSFEGGLTLMIGLSEEQYTSMEFSPDLYAEYGLDRAYTVHEEDGKTIYRNTSFSGTDLSSAIRGQRLSARFLTYGSDEYEHDRGYSKVDNDGVKVQWKRYGNPGYIFDYNKIMDEDQSSLHAKTNTHINDAMAIEVPALIKEGLSGWNVFVTKINKYGPSRVTDVYQSIFEKIR